MFANVDHFAQGMNICDSVTDMMISGTRHGLTPVQKEELFKLLHRLPNLQTLRHGNCQGADEEIDELVRSHVAVGGRELTIHIHPATNKTWSAACERRHGEHVLHACRTYLKRNEDMVNAAQLAVCFPKTEVEERRGGTWYVVRTARRTKTPLVIVYPSGALSAEPDIDQERPHVGAAPTASVDGVVG